MKIKTGFSLVVSLLMLVNLKAQQTQPQQPFITVTGEAAITVKADYLSITISAEATGETAQEAQDGVTDDIDAAVAYLKLNKAVSHVQSNYARIQLREGFISRGEFKAMQQATFRLNDMSVYNQVITELLDKGITDLRVGEPNIESPQALKQQAISGALQNAQEKAQLMATTMGTSLGGVLYIEEQKAGGFNPYLKSVSLDQGSNPAFEEARVTFTQAVTVRFALKP